QAEREGSASLVYRQRTKAGDYRWISNMVTVIKDAGGRPLYRVGSVRDITEQKRAEAALIEAEERARRRAEDLEAIMDAMPSIILIAHDPACQYMTSSRAANKLLGVPQGSNISLTAPVELHTTSYRLSMGGRELPPEERPMERAAARGESFHNCELCLRFADGSEAIVYGDVVPLLDAEGRPRGAVGSFTDITEKVRTERRLREAIQATQMLLGELKHRAKNSFAQIQSLISLTTLSTESGEVRAAFADLEARVTAISELYAILHGSESLTLLRLDEYLSRVAVALVQTTRGVALKTRMEALSCSPALAAPLGFILTELLTNAIKYAFPGGREGELSVSLRKAGAGAVLEVGDDGVGLPRGFDPAGPDSGSGLLLVRSLADQAKASFSIAEGTKGTRCRVEFPLEA
ncbi:MAG TPA: PAS domain S-box protein, partial [Rectinemataceae bacterium]|nr:PAS domain S-box protein [Rectinemataceae bacterium]